MEGRSAVPLKLPDRYTGLCLWAAALRHFKGLH